tara:strand:- start:2313 stop:2513 length:201 start_codon:yes stop_codon:yes gene_type:complete
MDPIYLIEKSLKELRKREEELTEVLKTGGVQDWVGYQRILGELSGLSTAEKIIIDLQNNKGQKDEY